jgi:hypothetical protein
MADLKAKHELAHAHHELAHATMRQKHAVHRAGGHVVKLHSKLKLIGEIQVKSETPITLPGLDLTQAGSGGDEKSLRFGEVLDILVDAYKKIEPAMAAVRHEYIKRSPRGIDALEKLEKQAHEALLNAIHAARRLDILEESGLGTLLRRRFPLNSKEISKLLLAELDRDTALFDARNLAEKVERFGFNSKSLARFLNTYGPFIKILEQANTVVDFFNCLADLSGLVLAAKHNDTHQLLYKGSELAFDVAILALPPLVVLKCLAWPYLEWVQTQIEKGSAVDHLAEQHLSKNAVSLRYVGGQAILVTTPRSPAN